MALLDSEVRRIRAELGYNVLGIAALPYIGITAIFESVIQQYITAGATTMSSSPVTAALDPTPQSLALVDATGFHIGDRVIVDVDSRQESATIQNISGVTLTALFSLSHTGTYPVTVEGGESIVREKLRELRDLQLGGTAGNAGAMSKLKNRLGLKKVDDVEFYGGNGLMSQGESPQKQLTQMVETMRDELANVLGVARLNRRGGGTVCESY